MTFNAASRLRSLEDRSAALGSSRCELPGMHSVPKSAVLPYASGVGGLSRRLLNKEPTRIMEEGHPQGQAWSRRLANDHASQAQELPRGDSGPGRRLEAFLFQLPSCWVAVKELNLNWKP